MQCNCIKDTEERVREHMQPKISAPIESVKMGNTSFVLEGNGMRTSLFAPVYIKADVKGYRSQQGGEIHMHFSFCPFCGTPVTANETAN